MKNNQKKEGTGFWKKLGLIVSAVGLVAAGAVAEKKFGVVDKTVNFAVKGFNAGKTGFKNLIAKKPQVSAVEVDTTTRNYQGNYSQNRKYNN